jgi:hypothetical protein
MTSILPTPHSVATGVAPAPSVYVAGKFGNDFRALGAEAVTPKSSTDLGLTFTNSTREIVASHLLSDTIEGVHIATDARFVDQQPVDLTLDGLLAALKGANLSGVQGIQAHGMNGQPGMVQVFVTPSQRDHLDALLRDDIDGWHVVLTPAMAIAPKS